MTRLIPDACEEFQQNMGTGGIGFFVPADGADAKQDGALPGQTFDLPGLQLSTGVHEHVASVYCLLYIMYIMHTYIYISNYYRICTHARERTACTFACLR